MGMASTVLVSASICLKEMALALHALCAKKIYIEILKIKIDRRVVIFFAVKAVKLYGETVSFTRATTIQTGQTVTLPIEIS
jgi:hypothetical protein